MVAGLVDHQIPTTRSDADRGLIADSHVVGFEQREDGMSLVKNQDTRDILERCMIMGNRDHLHHVLAPIVACPHPRGILIMIDAVHEIPS